MTTRRRLVDGFDCGCNTLASRAPAEAQEKKPNIVFMLTDNLDYGELGVYGRGILRGARTPP